MNYRRFPLIEDREVSALGLGCMRLPILGEDPGSIDEAELEAMLLNAADLGVNYLDTAYPYHKGRSETVLGTTLAKTGLRDKFAITTKCPTWLVKEKGDWERFLDEQLARLGTDHIDNYFFHALGRERWETVRRLGGIEFFEKAKADGRIGHIGFSFHDSLSAFKEIVDGYGGWELAQVQFNYVDRDFQAGEEGIAYAAAREIGIVVMEPLRGGVLARPPQAIREVFAKYPVPRLPYEWALRFALDRQEVVTVLSGMASANQVLENAAVAASVLPNSMTKKELLLLDEARKIYKDREMVPCTTCGYCQPCPSAVAIPDIFGVYNTATMFDMKADRTRWYGMSYLNVGKGADKCTRCGECLAKCPQGIAIPDRLDEAHAFFTGA